LGLLFPIYGKKKVPNHQPANNWPWVALYITLCTPWRTLVFRSSTNFQAQSSQLRAHGWLLATPQQQEGENTCCKNTPWRDFPLRVHGPIIYLFLSCLSD
jgi:hypothetical protein